MVWKNAKMLMVSTAALIVTSQVVKRVYRYFFRAPSYEISNNNCDDKSYEVLSLKNREINDVILFSDELLRHTIKVPPNDIIIGESREFNYYKLIKYLKSARESLDVCMYLITSSEIVEQIIRLGQKHIIVRIIVDSDMAFTPPSQIKQLQDYSFIQVQTSKKSILMHHKFCIIDGPNAIKRKMVLKAYAEKLNVHGQWSKNKLKSSLKTKAIKGFVMSGSLNWSTQAMVSNNESVIVTSHQTIVGKLEKEFERLWVENEPALLTTASLQ